LTGNVKGELEASSRQYKCHCIGPQSQPQEFTKVLNVTVNSSEPIHLRQYATGLKPC